ncbi:MAG: acyl-CoA dehydrogenase family protein [Hyphomonadaceae bacterium]
MDFDDTPQDAAFRAEARTWINANAPVHLRSTLHASAVGEFNRADAKTIADAKAWQKKKCDAGWACLHWPKEYGGREATPIQRVIWDEEEGPYASLGGIYLICHNMCGPTMLAYASEDLLRRYMTRMAAGELICCQLFSEPAGGSDLAGLRTRAAPAEDGSGDWIVNGQKIWTSGAHFADMGLLLARTDPSTPKHKGLTMFFLDMKTPGVEVRPIKQANGQFGFNEVFFTNVRIKDDHRIGAVGEGWRASLTTLMNERFGAFADMAPGLAELFELCGQLQTDAGSALDDRMVRARLAQWATRLSGLKYLGFRTRSAISRGVSPGPENSIGKLVGAAMSQDIAMFALDLMAQHGAVLDPSTTALSTVFQNILMRSPGGRIEGGSDEIMRNIIAERVLGLPGDVRVDKNVAFIDIPTAIMPSA